MTFSIFYRSTTNKVFIHHDNFSNHIEQTPLTYWSRNPPGEKREWKRKLRESCCSCFENFQWLSVYKFFLFISCWLCDSIMLSQSMVINEGHGILGIRWEVERRAGLIDEAWTWGGNFLTLFKNLQKYCFTVLPHLDLQNSIAASA